MRQVIALALGLLISTAAVADDWPQWMGPKRDNIWREKGLLKKFPENGPKLLWKTEIAGGYAGPAVANGKVFVTDYVTADNVKIPNFERKLSSGTERVLCLDEKTGKILWKHEYPVKYAISYPAGPRCTPTVQDGKVYTLGAVGNLFCFDADTGKILWSKDFQKLYDTQPALWGYTNHPLVYGNSLICVAGGEGSLVVAYDKNTGKELWKSLTSTEQGYCPPTIFKVAGVDQMILPSPDAVSSIDPKTGKVYWTVPYQASNGSIIMTPILLKNYLYVGGYSNKSMLIELNQDKPGAKVVWKNKRGEALSPVNVQPFLQGDVMYGYDQDGILYAVKLPSGKRLWQSVEPLGKEVGSGTAFIVKQGDRFWLFTENGDLIICKLTPKGYEEIDRAKIIEPTNEAFRREVVWCAPAFANHRIYVRNDREIRCLSLAE